MLEIDFTSHAVWGVLSQIETALDSFSPPAKADPRYQDINRKVEYLKWTLNHSDPFLVADAELLQLRNDLQSIIHHLNSDAANFQHLPSISNIFSGIFSRFPYPRIQRIFKSEANSVIAELRGTANAVIGNLKSSANQVEAQLRDIADATTKSQVQIKATADAISTLDAQLATKLEVWEGQFATEMRERVSEFNLKFSEFIAEKTEDLRMQIAAMRKDTDSSREAMATQSKSVSDQRAAEKQFFQQELEKHRKLASDILKRIEGIYEAAGQIALSGGFVEAAVSEKKLYEDNAWYAKFFFTIAATVLAAFWALHLLTTPTSLNDVLLRLPISLVFFVPAVYFSRLASKHRLTSVGLQSLGLRIKAFDAYLIAAKDAERQKLRAEMANVFFDDAREKSGSSGVSEAMLSKLTDKVGQLIEKVVEKFPIGEGKQ